MIYNLIISTIFREWANGIMLLSWAVTLLTYPILWMSVFSKPGKSIKEGLHDWFEESADDI